MSVVCVPHLGKVTLSNSFSPMVVQWLFRFPFTRTL